MGDSDVEYSPEQLFLFRLSMMESFNDPAYNKYITDLEQSGHRFSTAGFALIPPDGDFGYMKPMWLNNVSGLFSHEIERISDGIFFLYLCENIDSITIIKLKTQEAIFSFKGKSAVGNMDLDDFNPNGDLVARCSQNGIRECNFLFGRYWLSSGGGTRPLIAGRSFHEKIFDSSYLDKATFVSSAIDTDAYTARIAIDLPPESSSSRI